MEEDMIINSIDMYKVLPSLAYLNKKRKFQAEQLGMPLPKHMCSHQSYADCSSSPTSTETKESLSCMIKGETDGMDQDDDSELDSEKGSNSFSGDADSVTSGEAKTDPGRLKACSSDQASTSSFNWGSNLSKDALYSLESRSVTKPPRNRPEQPSIGKEWDPYLNYEEYLPEFGDHGDCACPECMTEGVELSTEKEVENLLYSNGVDPSNYYVLSSGRWNVNQDAQPGPKKLTIDKEFEQYFSTLML